MGGKTKRSLGRQLVEKAPGGATHRELGIGDGLGYSGVTGDLDSGEQL